MSPRDRIRHLHRRLGFGATPAEVDADVEAGFEATRKRLVEYPKTPVGIAPDPQEFVWREGQDPDSSAPRYRAWWVVRMLTTPRPLEEKLAIFWHDHFAVSDAKVGNGPMMLGYLQTLREHAGGRFGDLLSAVSKEPAMMRWLDLNRSIRGVPNENFGREVMELFTLGIGNYTEDDVKEVARAFTGWSYADIYRDLPGDANQKMRDAIAYDRPFAAFSVTPALHDPGPKTILGRTAPYDGDAVLGLLANHPQTARHLCRKLWTYFAYDDPDPKLVEALAGVWKGSKGDVLAVVDAITKRPEFYSERCVRTRVKSPPDLVLGVARAMGVGRRLLESRPPTAKPTDPIPKSILDAGTEASTSMARMGMTLFYPPDVGGWHWGAAWVSPAMMLERIRFRGVRLGAEGTKGAQAALQATAPSSVEALAAAMLDLFDVPLEEARRAPLVAALDRGGGLKALASPGGTASLLRSAMPVLMAAPEANLC